MHKKLCNFLFVIVYIILYSWRKKHTLVNFINKFQMRDLMLLQFKCYGKIISRESFLCKCSWLWIRNNYFWWHLLTKIVYALQDFSSSWDIRATPTFFFLKDGQQLDKLVGANKPELQKKIIMLSESYKPCLWFIISL